MVHPILSHLVNFGGVPAKFDGEIAEWIFIDYFDALVYAEVLYIVMVCVGPQIMKNREPIQLKPLVTLWNLFLTVFSLGGSIGVGTILFYFMEDRGFYEMTCHFDKSVVYDGELSFWLFAFLLSKIPEMLDTVFLILQKKPVIFLHWYHHLTVTIFCWYAGLSLIPSGAWFAGMNYAVHSIMYFYYFLCSLGLRKWIRPIAPLITGAQLLQMIAGTGIVCYTYYHAYWSGYGCGIDQLTIRMGLCMYASYFVLFAILFANLYLSGGSASKKKINNNNNTNNNGNKMAVEGGEKKNGVAKQNGNGQKKKQ